MATLNVEDAYVAGLRYGLGLRPGEIAAMGDDPRGRLKAQLQVAATLPMPYATLENSAALLTRATQEQRDQLALTRAIAEGTAPAGAQRQLQDTRRAIQAEQQDHLRLRLRVAVSTTTPFVERLVRFWSNHFTIAVGTGAKQVLARIAVPFENEAIRMRMGGSFADMLIAVEQHPAMLTYLDNTASAGSNSTVGQRRNRGLNENLAREILELHTLGVNGGYTQTDVTNLARIISGWTVNLGDVLTNTVPSGAFLFSTAMHEPGTLTLLGKSYGPTGVAQGEAALRDLAAHPATARHIATKLVRHFVADTPPQSAVAQIEKVFLSSGGHLPSVHAELIALEAAWSGQSRKLKTPEELVIATGRALDTAGVPVTSNTALTFLLDALTTFGQVPFTAPSPAGWADTAEFWSSPDSLLKRIEWSAALTRMLPDSLDANALYTDLLPLDPMLLDELDMAESNKQALAILLASPQFQWR